MAWVSWRVSSGSQFSSSCSCSWSQLGDKMPAWESACRLRAWALRTPVEQPSRMRKKCCYGQRNLRSICCSLSPSPTHLSHITNINPFATLSGIKCERYIFLKKCVRSSLLLIMFPHVYVYSFICITVIRHYTVYLYHCNSFFSRTSAQHIKPLYKSLGSNLELLSLELISVLPTVLDCQVGWGCRIYQLLLGRGVRPPPQQVS